MSSVNNHTDTGRRAGAGEIAAAAALEILGALLLFYAGYITIFLTKSKEELKSLLKAKEENERAGLKLNIQKMKIMASGPITSWQIDGETMETVTDYFWGLQNRYRW